MLPQRGSLLERVSREEWNIGVVPQSISDIARRGLTQRVRWLPPMHPWYGLADPACSIASDGSRILYAERLNYWTGRGEIWSAYVSANDDLASAEFHPWATADVHLSYPFPFEADGERYVTMECAESGGLNLWRYSERTWQPLRVLNRPAIDATIWHGDGWWLFCTFADDQPDLNLHIFHADTVTGPWLPHPGNPVKSDLASSRPAGPLFVSDGHLYRPSQDCTQSYGSAIVINKIDQLNRHEFREHPARRLVPLADYPHGLHTLCPAGDSTIIDGKRWGFRAIDPVRYAITGVRRRLRRIRAQQTDVRFL